VPFYFIVFSLASTSSSLPQRRSSRISSQPARYDEEQVSIRLQEQEEKELQLALQQSLELDDESSTDEDLSPILLESEEEEEEKQEQIVQEERGWTRDIHNIILPSFSSPFGSIHLLRSTTSALHFFQLFLPLPLITHIVSCTNEYANSKNIVDWIATDTSELYCFLGLLIYMGIDPLPQLPMYWSYFYSHSFVTSAISRDRFQQLLRCFHVSTLAQQQQNNDRLKKVRWFSQRLQQIFSSHYFPSQKLTVDEAMVPFKGRSQIKQYIPQKPTKWGYKIWCLVSSNYLLAFEIYEGKTSIVEKNLGSDVVLRLTSPYQHNNHILYFDRYFTSPTLLDELLVRGIRACGTVRKDRVGLPPTFKTVASEMEQGEMKYWQRGELGAVVWKDRKAVYLLTTHKSPADITYINRSGSTTQVAIPSVVLDYNKYKGGVDTIDQMRESYSIGRKSKKWWPNLVWWLIDMCILNAYSLYNQQQQVKIRQLEFREQLMQQLVEQYKQERSRRGRPPHSPRRRSQQEHWPEHTEEQGDCVYCSRQPDERTRSRVRCELCQVHLCIDPCFKLFHVRHQPEH
jgi:Transposase IS4